MKDNVKKNLEGWLENPSWREYYETAPSEQCREVIALEFYLSEYELDETLREIDKAEDELSLEDWRHLYRWCGNNPRKKAIHDRIVALGGSGNQV